MQTKIPYQIFMSYNELSYRTFPTIIFVNIQALYSKSTNTDRHLVANYWFDLQFFIVECTIPNIWAANWVVTNHVVSSLHSHESWPLVSPRSWMVNSEGRTALSSLHIIPPSSMPERVNELSANSDRETVMVRSRSLAGTAPKRICLGWCLHRWVSISPLLRIVGCMASWCLPWL